MALPKPCAASPELGAASGRGDVAHRVVCLLEILRGAARGGMYAAQGPVYGALEAVQGPLLGLAHALRQNAAVICLILKLAGDIVESHVSYLEVGPSPHPFSIHCSPPFCTD